MANLTLPGRVLLGLSCTLLALPGFTQTIQLTNWTPAPYWAADSTTSTYQGERGAAITGPLPMVAVTPCRVMDTRPEYAQFGFAGSFGAPALGGGQVRDVPIPASSCGIPANARAYSLNITVVPAGTLQYLTAWPAGFPKPNTSTLNSYEGKIVANAAAVPAGVNGAISLFASDTTHVIVDINGYYTDLVGVGGATGPTGPQGSQGMVGPTGNQGPVGPAGPAGPAGAAGAASTVPGPTGPVGPTGVGLTGAIGATGATGATGVTGAQGPTGTASGGLSAYGSFSNDSGSAYNVTIGGVSIDFFDTAVANNISLTSPIATLPQAGTYRFWYCIRTTAPSSASSRLVVNGSAINASIITPVTQTDKWCRVTMLSLISTNSTVQVQLFGTFAPVTLLSPGGAELVIEKLN
ncbi:MAG: hypothetical protein U0R19_28570 [Bryobacteraceae bacterium]